MKLLARSFGCGRYAQNYQKIGSKIIQNHQWWMFIVPLPGNKGKSRNAMRGVIWVTRKIQKAQKWGFLREAWGGVATLKIIKNSFKNYSKSLMIIIWWMFLVPLPGNMGNKGKTMRGVICVTQKTQKAQKWSFLREALGGVAALKIIKNSSKIIQNHQWWDIFQFCLKNHESKLSDVFLTQLKSLFTLQDE